jgi:hypothetical protein
MTSDAAAMQGFSIVAGGPMHQLGCRLGLSDADFGRLPRRIAFAIGLFWVPLLVLSLIDGRALAGARVPFLYDVDTAMRYLVALPLMLAAERLLHVRMVAAMGHFQGRQLVARGARARLDHILESTRRWIGSPLAEAALLAFVYLVGIEVIWRQVSVLELDTWYARASGGEFTPHLAGHWMAWVSVPLFQFLILRWYYRLLLWLVLLVRLARLPLQLQPLHPDRAGGLGFLSQLSLAFAPLLMAQGTMASGWVAGQIMYSGATLTDFKLELVAATVISLAFVLLPTAAFARALADAKRLGLSAYGCLAVRYAIDFNRKWAGTTADRGASPLGNPDMQSLADLGNAYGPLSGMRVVPFSSRTVLQLGAAFLAPVAPLAFTMVSLDELLNRAMEMLL